jgi:hypothetical protein
MAKDPLVGEKFGPHMTDPLISDVPNLGDKAFD